MDPQPGTTTLTTTEAWEAHAAPLLHHLLGLTRDRELAEDLVQETFLRLVREELAGRSPDHTRGWLYRVAGNLLMSHGRHVQVARREMARLALAANPVTGSSEAEVGARETLCAVMAGISTLSSIERRAITLAAAECSNAEMARAMGVSREAARARLCRARAHLTTATAT